MELQAREGSPVHPSITLRGGVTARPCPCHASAQLGAGLAAGSAPMARASTWRAVGRWAETGTGLKPQSRQSESGGGAGGGEGKGPEFPDSRLALANAPFHAFPSSFGRRSALAAGRCKQAKMAAAATAFFFFVFFLLPCASLSFLPCSCSYSNAWSRARVCVDTRGAQPQESRSIILRS